MDAAPHRSAGIFLVCAALTGLLLAAAAPAAHAAGAGNQAVDRVTALNRQALERYNRRDYGGARALLKQALQLCNSTGLADHPIRARTHIHMGVVVIVGFKQHDLGLQHFRKALEIEPDIKLTKSVATPDLEAAFAEASTAVAGAAGDATTAEGAAGGGDDKSGEADQTRAGAGADAGQGGADGAEAAGSAPAYKIYLSAAVGSGFGVASGSAEMNAAHRLKVAGLAPGQLGQISPELGYFVTPHLLLSARLRLQYVSGLTGQASPTGCGADHYCQPNPYAVAGFARATYFRGGGPFRLFLAVDIGGGNIRHAQLFKADATCGVTATQQCVDSLGSGPFLFGPAVGFLWDLNGAVGLVVSLAVDLGVPKFTANFDLNAGLAAHF